MHRLLITAFFLASAGCSAGSSSESVDVRSDSAGIRIVDHNGPDRPLNWNFTRAWTVGGASDDRLPLPDLGVHQVAVGPAGHIAVLDEAGYRVLVFSPDGEFVRVIGREGGGPGELLSPSALAIEGDGTIAVYDYGKQALVRWRMDGEPRQEVRVAAPYWGPKLRINSSGSPIFTALGAGDAATSEQWLVEWDTDHERRIAHFRRMADRQADLSVCGFGELPMPPLFAPELNWDAAAGRVAYNIDAAYRIDVVEAGRVVSSIRRDIPLRTVTEGMALKEAGDGFPIPLANCTVPPAVLVREQGYAAVVPSITELAMSPAGEIWVRRGSAGDEPRRADVYTRDGAYLGTLSANAPFPAAFLPDGLMIAIEPDSLDVPRIVAYEITRS